MRAPVHEEASAPVPTAATATAAQVGLTEVVAAFMSATAPVRDRSGILRGNGLMTSATETNGLVKLIGDFGAPLVIEAIDQAGLSNTRDKVTVNFVRSIAERMAREKATASANVPPGRLNREQVLALVDESLAGHPAAGAVRPLAIAAAEVFGICPIVQVLELWLDSGFDAARVRYGCVEATQAHPLLEAGKLVNVATRMIRNARPENSGPPPGLEVHVLPTPPEPTPEQRAQIQEAWKGLDNRFPDLDQESETA